MSLFLRIDINVIAAAILFCVFIIAKKSLEKQDKLNSIFLIMSVIIMIELVFETATCLLNGHPGDWVAPVSNGLHICLFLGAPILTYFWFVFVTNWLDMEIIGAVKRNLLLIPIFINMAIVALSPVFGFIFYINAANGYERGPLYFLSTAIVYFYMIASIVFLLRRKKKMMNEEFLPLIIISSIPMIGGILQALFYGPLLVWSCTAFSLIVVYIYLQQRMIRLDKLTGAWTRESLNFNILRRIKQSGEQTLGIIFLDLDGLKRINDEYGHMEGDNALHTSVELIKSMVRKTDIVARFGGDEFIIVLESESRQLLDKTVDRLKNCFMQYNETSGKSYNLEFSFGADILNANFGSLDQFLYHVDNLMYSNKRQKREIAVS